MLECGDKIGDYTLAGFLGRGQFGEVWLAEKSLPFSTRKFQHALKFLFKRGDEIDLRSAEAEIDTWIEASGHPNVMSVLDMIVHNDYIIIVSEFAEGGSLKSWLNKFNGKAPSHEKALDMMMGILRGIGHLHNRNVVHRDLKPDNILLQGNFPRITDFGISRIVSAGSLSTVAMGSPFYMSPESFDGSKSIQTDIWSAGVILYEMLTGEHPYRSDTIYGLVSAIREDEPKPLPKAISPELGLIVNTALQKDTSKRYRTALDMRKAVEAEIYHRKLRSSKLRAPMDANLARAVPVVPSAATLSDDGSNSPSFDEAPGADLPDPGKMPRRTQPTDVKNTVAAEPGEVEWSQETRVLADDLEDRVDLAPSTASSLEAERDPFESINEEFGTSRFTASRRPFWTIAVVVSLLTVALGLGLFAVSNSFFSGGQDGSSASTGTSREKGASEDPAANAPPGMKYIQAGEFIMGRNDAKYPDEKPAHRVKVTSFYMDVYEVTNEDFSKFVNEKNQDLREGEKNPYLPQGWANGSYPRGKEKYPVVGVNWMMAYAYAEWMHRRLPTEEEWEFAARGPSGFLYAWGNHWSIKFANVARNSLVAVGTFPGGSPFGIKDMIGNAWEWTADDFQAYPGGHISDDLARKQNLKTIRGGSFEADEDTGAATYRVGLEASGAERGYDQTGFRCVKDLVK